MRPIGSRRAIPTNVLAFEIGNRRVLIDAGMGTADIEQPRRRLGAGWVTASRPVLDTSVCAVRQIENLDWGSNDVTDIVMTHLDLDHAGGLADFPDAKVHVGEAELAAAAHGAPIWSAQNSRYRSVHWLDANLQVHAPGNTEWFGIDGCTPIPGFDGDVLFVPLPGHSFGHCGVAVRHDDRWLLHAGDAILESATSPKMAITLRAFERFIAADGSAAIASRGIVGRLAADAHIDVVASHVV
jgi:glyoxylase-like metal-dependent hydrolase (beta-lactamase superfamily II)